MQPTRGRRKRPVDAPPDGPEGRQKTVWVPSGFQERSRQDGGVELAAYLKTGFTTLDHLYLSINLLDVEGKVIETKRIKSFGHKSWILTMGAMSFTRRLEPPEGTAAIAFSYKGRVTEGGSKSRGTGTGGDAIFWNFWEVPQR